jgi:hypothetical protein
MNRENEIDPPWVISALMRRSSSLLIVYAASLTPIVTTASEDHRHSVSVCDLNRRRVAPWSARLHHRRDASCGRGADPLCEREVGITCEHRAACAITSTLQRNLNCNAAVDLSRANAERCGVAREDDRVGADVSNYSPGEEQIGELLERRPPLSYYMKFSAFDRAVIARLKKKVRAKPKDVECGWICGGV